MTTRVANGWTRTYRGGAVRADANESTTHGPAATSLGRPTPTAVRDRGAADALGAALLAPAAIGLALVILFLGRGVDGRATVQSAAESAAQAAAQERTPGEAIAAAQQVGAAMLIDSTSCGDPAVSVDTSAFGPGGQVAVTVSCSVSSAGLELIDPPAATSTATAFATIDPYRATEAAP